MPPGPRGLTLARIVRQMVRDPIPAMEELQRRWGDIVGLDMPSYKMVLLFHPGDIEQLLVAHARATGKGASVRRATRVLGRNMFVLEGEEHTRRRRIASPVFRPRDIAPYGAWTRSGTAEMTGGWRDGEPVDIGSALDHMVIGAVGHALFGQTLATHAERIEQLTRESNANFPLVLNPLFPLIGRLPLPAVRSMDRTARDYDALVRALIERWQRNGRGDEAAGHLLARLLRASETGERLEEEELVQEMRGFVLAGHDTTAMVLTWALWLLARHPDVTDRLIAEVDDVTAGEDVTVEHLAQLTWTRAVLDETLRLYGGTFAVREALAELQIGPLRARAGWELVAGMWNVHRDARWWDRPGEFLPQRFLEPAAERPRFAYFPFGGGRRTCIGRHLAVQSGTIALAEIHRQWRLQPGPGSERLRATSRVLVRPSAPAMLIPRRR